jgi:hypothetical protein
MQDDDVNMNTDVMLMNVEELGCEETRTSKAALMNRSAACRRRRPG